MRFDFTGVFVKLRVVGAYDHDAVTGVLAWFSDRKTDRRSDFDMAFQLDLGWVMGMPIDAVRRQGDGAGAIERGDGQVLLLRFTFLRYCVAHEDASQPNTRYAEPHFAILLNNDVFRRDTGFARFIFRTDPLTAQNLTLPCPCVNSIDLQQKTLARRAKTRRDSAARVRRHG